MRVEVTSDDRHRLYLYDGKISPSGPGSSTTTPPSLPRDHRPTPRKSHGEIRHRTALCTTSYNWGNNDDDINKIKTAVDIGPSTVKGVTCEHYAFHQQGVDWQIWIQLGEFPLPRKLVITTLTDEARPQHSDTLTWNLAPSFNDGAFVFDPPPDAKKIILEGKSADTTEKGK